MTINELKSSPKVIENDVATDNNKYKVVKTTGKMQQNQRTPSPTSAQDQIQQQQPQKKQTNYSHLEKNEMN